MHNLLFFHLRLWEEYELAIPLHHDNHWQKIFNTERAKELYRLPLEHKQWPLDVSVTHNSLWLRIMSKSYVAILDDGKQKKLKKDFENLLTEYGIPQDETPFLFCDNTDLYWCQKK